jgi:hypothetical protein
MTKEQERQRLASRRRLNKRSTSEWLQLLEEINPYTLRLKVASIVWWDFISNNPEAAEFRKILRLWKEVYHYPNMEIDIFNALVKLGYHKPIAKKRSVIPSWKTSRQ